MSLYYRVSELTLGYAIDRYLVYSVFFYKQHKVFYKKKGQANEHGEL